MTSRRVHPRSSRTALLALGLVLGGAAGARAGTSNETNPVVVFATPGAKQVTFTACNAGGCSSVTRTVTVLDPQARVSSATASPPEVVQGQHVQLAGAGTGMPPLALGWRVVNGSGTTVATLAGPNAVWDTSGAPPGAYSVVLEVGNPLGIQASTAIPVTVLPDPFLFADGFESAGTGAWTSASPP